MERDPTTTEASTAQPSPSDSKADRPSRSARAVLLVLCAAVFLDGADVSMTGVALPSIQTDLGMSTSSLQWVVSAYVLGYGGFLLLGGRTADLFGRRRVFLVSLAVFVAASGLGALANDGTLLIATRLVKGVSAGFTTPAALSIITTNFAEGEARNKALGAFAATGGAGFSLGLVLSGLLTEIGWRWVFAFPVPIALITLLAAVRLVPDDGRPERSGSRFDILGAVGVTAAMVLLVFTLVKAPDVGWGSVRTLASLAGVVVVLAAVVAHEARTKDPLIRLGILRSGLLVRANLGSMALLGAWLGFQFIATLYMQQLLGWSALETGLAIFPTGLLVGVLSGAVVPALVGRFGPRPVIFAGLGLCSAGYALFLATIELDSGYLALLPTFVVLGFGFSLAFAPLQIAATTGVAHEEQGLAGGLVQTSLQFGGALVLAIVTAVNAANTGGTPQGLLDGFRSGLIVAVVAAALGAIAIGLGRSRVGARVPASEPRLVKEEG